MPEEIKNPAEEEKITETADGGIAVSVEKEKEEEEPLQTEVQEKKEEEKETIKQDSWKNKVYAHDRILTNVQKSIEELKDIMIANSPSSTITQEQEVKLDELDKLAQTDWKAAVRKLAQAEANEILAKEKQKIEEQQSQEQISQLMEKNSQFVVSKHPELEDATSEKSQVFQETLNNNPRWRTSPDGPLLTMYEMENELRKRGYDIEGTTKEKVETERERIIKASGSSLSPSRTAVSGSKVILTREQKEFCDQNGVTYEDYARTLKKSGEKGGIEI